MPNQYHGLIGKWHELFWLLTRRGSSIPGWVDGVIGKAKLIDLLLTGTTTDLCPIFLESTTPSVEEKLQIPSGFYLRSPNSYITERSGQSPLLPPLCTRVPFSRFFAFSMPLPVFSHASVLRINWHDIGETARVMQLWTILDQAKYLSSKILRNKSVLDFYFFLKKNVSIFISISWIPYTCRLKGLLYNVFRMPAFWSATCHVVEFAPCVIVSMLKKFLRLASFSQEISGKVMLSLQYP